MAQFRYPQTDEDRLDFLKSTLAQVGRDTLVLDTFVPATLATNIQTFVSNYDPALKAVLALRGERSIEVDEKQEAITALGVYVRDFWAGLERRVIRENLPRGLFVEYGQLRSGDNAPGRRLQDWLRYSERIIEGEAHAVAKGYTPMANPSAAEVAAKRVAVVSETDDVYTASSALDKAQHVMDDLRSEADRLIRFVNSQLDMTFYGDSPDDIRAVKERYGFNYADATTVPVIPEEPETGGLDPAPSTPQ